MKSNSYINATKLCNDGNKLFKNWRKAEHAKNLINEVEKELAPNGANAIIDINTYENTVKGSYVHPNLIPHIASWISASFAIKVSKIIIEYAISQFQQQLTEKDEIITQSNDIIETKSENYVPLLRNEKDPIFVVNRIAEKTINFRCIQKRSYKRHTNEILYLETPNAKNILNRLKERIPFKYFTLILSDTFTEQQLIDIINEVNDEKYE
jgi:hypothetical protein